MFFTENNHKNFMFLGEAGCGKSEISVNLAMELASTGAPVHFFDLDMTKPLFRSRDIAEIMRRAGISVHFEKQFYDAPTTTGGVGKMLSDDSCYTILDIGGDHIGARAAGTFAQFIKANNCVVYYIINPYRPWSSTLEHIDAVLGQILKAARLQLTDIRFIGNPNLGISTSAAEVEHGISETKKLLGGTVQPEFYCVSKELAAEIKSEEKIFPIGLYLSYPWEKSI